MTLDFRTELIKHKRDKVKRRKRWAIMLAILVPVLVTTTWYLVTTQQQTAYAQKLESLQSQAGGTKLTAAQIKRNRQQGHGVTGDLSSSALNKDDLERAQKQMSLLHENVVGALSIPSVKINLAIMFDDSKSNLAIGAGEMKQQTMGKGNYALDGHNEFPDDNNLLFTGIQKLKKGDIVYITDMAKVYVYVITAGPQTVSFKDVHVIQDTPESAKKPILSLISCDNGGPATQHRFLIRGQLKQVRKYKTTDDKQFKFDTTKKVNY